MAERIVDSVEPRNFARCLEVLYIISEPFIARELEEERQLLTRIARDV